MEVFYKDIVDRLIEYRKSINLSQKAMAKKIGLAQSHYSKLERKTIMLTNDVFVKMHNSGVDVDYLVTGIPSRVTVINELFDKCAPENKANFMKIIISYINMVIGQKEEYLVCKNELALIQYHMDKNDNEAQESSKLDTVWCHIRKTHNLTQVELAEKMDMSLKRYREIEKGEAMPKIETLSILYDKLGYYPSLVQDIDTNYLLSVNRIWECLDNKDKKNLENIIRYSLEYINQNLSK